MKPYHGVITGTDLEEFPEPRKHTLLKIRKVVLFAQRLNFRLDLRVLRHGQVGNQMVLNLVIEPHLGIVDPVASGLVVHRSQYLTHVKLLFVFVVVVEAEQVGTGVIGTDDHVGVEVRDQLGQHSIDEHEQHRGFPQREKEKRYDHKMEHEKGQVAGEPKFANQLIPEVEKIGETDRSDLSGVRASLLLRFEGVERARRIVAELPGDTSQK